MSQYRNKNHGTNSNLYSKKKVHKYLKEYNMYEAYQMNQQKGDGCIKEDSLEFSTASSLREHEIHENPQ